MNDGKLPFCIMLDNKIYIDNALYECEVSCHVIGAARSETIAVIQADEDGNAVVGEYLALGQVGLPVRVLDRLMLLCFRLLQFEAAKSGGSAAEWRMADATKWLICQLGNDAPMVVDALRHRVVPGVWTRNVVWVRVD